MHALKNETIEEKIILEIIAVTVCQIQLRIVIDKWN